MYSATYVVEARVVSIDRVHNDITIFFFDPRKPLSGLDFSEFRESGLLISSSEWPDCRLLWLKTKTDYGVIGLIGKARISDPAMFSAIVNGDVRWTLTIQASALAEISAAPLERKGDL